MVNALIDKFERVSHVQNESIGGRRSTSRSADLIERARTITEETQETAVRELSRELEASKSSAHSILRNDLGKYIPI